MKDWKCFFPPSFLAVHTFCISLDWGRLGFGGGPWWVVGGGKDRGWRCLERAGKGERVNTQTVGNCTPTLDVLVHRDGQITTRELIKQEAK